MDMLKSQLVTISAMQSGKDGSSIMNAIYGIIMLSFIEQIFKYLPVIGAFFKKYSETYIKRRYGSMNIVNTIGNLKKELTGSIILEKSYLEKDSGQNSEFVEATLEYIAKLPNIKFLKYRTRFFVSHKEEFEIETNIYGRCLDCVQSMETGELEKITLQVYSHTMDIVQLRAFLNKIHKNYIISKKNQLGDQTYLFDHITAQNNNNIPVLRFDMTPFNTNKSLKTIYGSYMNNVVKRINFFIKNRDWYVKKGIPHTLGLLLHGPPGCGKTSLIKAMANDTHRHIINIQLNKSVTQSQLKSLFFNEEVFVFNKKTGQNELFLIPLEQRIYVMEDVDAISDILYSRNIINQQKELEEKMLQEVYEKAKLESMKKGYAPPPPPQGIRDDNKEQITLAFILNLLDGILETPGRIIILTTNHPEKLDSALVRPGRIDLNIHFNRCSKDTIVELVSKFYETIDEKSKEWCEFLSELAKLDEYMLTPAEVNKIIFNYYNEPELAFGEIIRDILSAMEKCKKEEEEKKKKDSCSANDTATASDTASATTNVTKSGNNADTSDTADKEVGGDTKDTKDAKDAKDTNEQKNKDGKICKFYVTTRETIIKMFGTGYQYFLEYLEDKMLVVQDTLLIDDKTLQYIHYKLPNSMKRGAIEHVVKENQQVLLKSSNASYELHRDGVGTFIYVDDNTHTLLNNFKVHSNLEQLSISELRQSNHPSIDSSKPGPSAVELSKHINKISTKIEEVYKPSNIVSFNGSFSNLGPNNFSSLDGSDNSNETGSSLDEFFKPIL